MFWKCIRWGGTLMVILGLLAAAFLAGHAEDAATPVQPAGEAAQPNKNFNL